MANVTPSWTIVHPAYVEPGLIMQYSQASAAFELLAGGAPMVKIGSEDKYVYAKTVDVRTQVSVSQSAANQLPSCSVVPRQISMPTYLHRTHAEYDHHDTAMMGEWDINIVEAQRLAMRQGHFQLARNELLYGNIPANGEGLMNSTGATTVSLPADSFGNDTASSYDPGQMAQFFLTQFQQTKQRSYQLGMPRRFVIIGPQRILGQFEYQGIVQLTSFQREGAGSTNVKGMLEQVAQWNGDTVGWGYDDTLQGMGAGGTDAILIVMPEVEKPRQGQWDTNAFADLAPGIKACTVMYADKAAPTEIPTPVAYGGIDVLSEMRVTPGWAWRPECVTVISMAP